MLQKLLSRRNFCLCCVIILVGFLNCVAQGSEKLKKYEPVLYLHSTERYKSMDVDSYVRRMQWQPYGAFGTVGLYQNYHHTENNNGIERKLEMEGWWYSFGEWGIRMEKNLSSRIENSWKLDLDTSLKLMEKWGRQWKLEIKLLQYRELSQNQSLMLGLRGFHDTTKFWSENFLFRNTSLMVYYCGNNVLAGNKEGKSYLRGQLAIEHGLITSTAKRKGTESYSTRGPLGIKISASVQVISKTEDDGILTEIGPEFSFGVNSHEGKNQINFVAIFYFRIIGIGIRKTQ